MGYRMKGSTFYGKSPLKAKKKTSSTQDKKPGIVGQDTGVVKKDSKGKDYGISQYDIQGGVNKGDTIFIPPSYEKNIIESGGDKYLADEDYTLTETKGSKKRKKGPKSYDVTGGYKWKTKK